ncbi:hypothetical protein [Halobiforma nitratireducens]|uniref:hypothetical protein n=1 Tax=Halobiforma nitratireducens TaxID=130048 RepID=UPI000ADDB093
MTPESDRELERLGVHDSVATVFPPAKLGRYLEGVPVDVAIVDDKDIGDCAAVVSLERRETFPSSTVRRFPRAP